MPAPVTRTIPCRVGRGQVHEGSAPAPDRAPRRLADAPTGTPPASRGSPPAPRTRPAAARRAAVILARAAGKDEKEATMVISERAGRPAEPSMLVDVGALVGAYYERRPDPGQAAERVAFGTSG